LRNLIVRLPDGALATDPRFEALLGDLERRIARGTLWVGPVAALGDWLRAAEQVQVHYQADGGATVRAPVDVRGVSFAVDRSATVIVDGTPLASAHSSDGETNFSIDLAAGKWARVELRDHAGSPVPLLGAR
jgi:hypothetical protein